MEKSPVELPKAGTETVTARASAMPADLLYCDFSLCVKKMFQSPLTKPPAESEGDLPGMRFVWASSQPVTSWKAERRAAKRR